MTLLDRAPDASAAAVEDIAAAWDTAARIGLRDRHLFEGCHPLPGGNWELFVPAARRFVRPAVRRRFAGTLSR